MSAAEGFQPPAPAPAEVERMRRNIRHADAARTTAATTAAATATATQATPTPTTTTSAGATAPTAPDKTAVEAMKKLYESCGGRLGDVARALDVTFKDGDVGVADADDFARRLLSGLLVKERA